MFEITFTVCSILHGAQCGGRTLTFEDAGQAATPYACMMPAMFQMAKWQEEHPNWRIESWRCGKAREVARI